MKSRIGKLEGDGRTNKRLQESLGKHVKILENALKKEREKSKIPQTESKPEEKREEKEAPKVEAKPLLKRMSIAYVPYPWLMLQQLHHQSHGTHFLILNWKTRHRQTSNRIPKETNHESTWGNAYKKSLIMSYLPRIRISNMLKSKSFCRTITIQITANNNHRRPPLKKSISNKGKSNNRTTLVYWVHLHFQTTNHHLYHASLIFHLLPDHRNSPISPLLWPEVCPKDNINPHL